MDNAKILGDFFVWIQAGHSKATVESYRYALRGLQEWTGIENKRILDLTLSDVGRYQMFLENKGLKGSTRFHYSTALRSLWRWLHDQGMVHWNWKLIPMPDSSDKQRMPALEPEEMEKILNYLCDEIPHELRDKTIISLLFATGLRLSEMISLDVSSLNLKERYLNVRTFKRRNHHRDLFWDDGTDLLLRKWLLVRQSLLNRNKSCTNALFIGLNPLNPGQRVYSDAIQKRFRQLRKELKIDKKITPHTCRHGFGTFFGKRSGDVFSLQQLMGHANINHTHQYVHLERSHLREAYNRVKSIDQNDGVFLNKSLALDTVSAYAKTGENETEQKDLRVLEIGTVEDSL